jgi:AraC-like DNA-binding protein
MDALSDVLKVTQLTGGVFLHAEFTAPWCLATRVSAEYCAPALGSASHLIPYHYVVEGDLSLRVEGASDQVLELGVGDVVVLPGNHLHIMGSDLALPPTPGREVIRRHASGELLSIHHGGGGKRTRLVCGFLGYDGVDGNPLISTLPSALKSPAGKGAAAEWIRTTFEYAAEEIAAGRPGSEAVLAKLSELLFVEAVRRHVETLPPGRTGLLAGLGDVHVARALALIHADIARRWTVDDLGREVGLSRSALADRFTRLVGTPPMHYVASWRLQVAMQKLLGTGASLAQVAGMVGYDSEAAFSRAFKKGVGVAPAGWRRTARR